MMTITCTLFVKRCIALNPSKQLDDFNDVVDAASVSTATTVNNSYNETRVEGLAADDFPAPKEIAGGNCLPSWAMLCLPLWAQFNGMVTGIVITVIASFLLSMQQ